MKTIQKQKESGSVWPDQLRECKDWQGEDEMATWVYT